MLLGGNRQTTDCLSRLVDKFFLNKEKSTSCINFSTLFPSNFILENKTSEILEHADLVGKLISSRVPMNSFFWQRVHHPLPCNQCFTILLPLSCDFFLGRDHIIFNSFSSLLITLPDAYEINGCSIDVLPNGNIRKMSKRSDSGVFITLDNPYFIFSLSLLV